MSELNSSIVYFAIINEGIKKNLNVMNELKGNLNRKMITIKKELSENSSTEKYNISKLFKK